MLAVIKHRAVAVAEDILIDGTNSETPVHRRQNAIFDAIATAVGNSEHAAALEGLSQRLEPVQRLEEAFLNDTEAETSEILRSLRARDRKALRASLLRYHRRRVRIIPELLAKLLQG
jgi:hypothetical protein